LNSRSVSLEENVRIMIFTIADYTLYVKRITTGE